MSKILNSVLEKVSENNNEYRTFLRDLNVKIDEKTTAFVGDVVTASGYTVDFSNAITLAKEKIVNPVSRTVESYVIKDLRSVEIKIISALFVLCTNEWKQDISNLTKRN